MRIRLALIVLLGVAGVSCLSGCATSIVNMLVFTQEMQRFRYIDELDDLGGYLESDAEEHRLHITAILNDGAETEFVHVVDRSLLGGYRMREEPQTWVLFREKRPDDRFGPGMLVQHLGTDGRFVADVAPLTEHEWRHAAIVQLHFADGNRDVVVGVDFPYEKDRIQSSRLMLATGLSSDRYTSPNELPMGPLELALYTLYPPAFAFDAVTVGPVLAIAYLAFWLDSSL